MSLYLLLESNLSLSLSLSLSPTYAVAAPFLLLVFSGAINSPLQATTALQGGSTHQKFFFTFISLIHILYTAHHSKKNTSLSGPRFLSLLRTLLLCPLHNAGTLLVRLGRDWLREVVEHSECGTHKSGTTVLGCFCSQRRTQSHMFPPQKKYSMGILK